MTTERPRRGRGPPLPRARLERSTCPIANTLEIFGDRWTFLIVRDLVFGKTRYGEFARSKEGIPTNILSERLQRLEEAGIVETRLYRRHPPRAEYLLTRKGAELGPILRDLAEWGLKHIPGTRPPSPPLPVPVRPGARAG